MAKPILEISKVINHITRGMSLKNDPGDYKLSRNIVAKFGEDQIKTFWLKGHGLFDNNSYNPKVFVMTSPFMKLGFNLESKHFVLEDISHRCYPVYIFISI